MAETAQGAGIERKPAAGAAGNATPGPAERVLNALKNIGERLTTLPPGKRNALIASVAVVLAVCSGIAWYVGRPDWKVLFSGLDSKDIQQVSGELAAAGIKYQTTADGSGIEVPAELVDKARMEVAGKGMPQTGRLGFELFDKPNWVGSEFDEHVNYQRALEGELEHTIATLGAVHSARVHLVLPQPSLFLAQEKIAKASVVLKLKRSVMPQAEADSIRALVAGAVENLSPDQVTLVDADGRVNLKPRAMSGVEDEEMEAGLEAKLVAMLEPLAGRDNVRATVNVSYDQGSESRVDEIYDPSQSAPINFQKSEQTAPGRSQPGGVPGTASNTPAAAAKGAVAGSAVAAAPGTPPLLQNGLPVYPQGNQLGQTLKEENGTYGVTKHTIRSDEGPGRVRRVTAAVLVNDRMLTEGTGKTEHAVWKPRSGEEMKKLEDLAQAAVGFDPKRGDQVVMHNISFTSNLPEPKPSAVGKAVDSARSILQTQPGLLKSAITGLCALLLVMFVVRPAVSQITATLKEPMMMAAPAPAGPNIVELAAPEPEPLRIETQPAPRLRANSQNRIFEYVADSVERDAAQATRLLEAWIGTTNGETEA